MSLEATSKKPPRPTPKNYENLANKNASNVTMGELRRLGRYARNFNNNYNELVMQKMMNKGKTPTNLPSRWRNRKDLLNGWRYNVKKDPWMNTTRASKEQARNWYNNDGKLKKMTNNVVTSAITLQKFTKKQVKNDTLYFDGAAKRNGVRQLYTMNQIKMMKFKNPFTREPMLPLKLPKNIKTAIIKYLKKNNA